MTFERGVDNRQTVGKISRTEQMNQYADDSACIDYPPQFETYVFSRNLITQQYIHEKFRLEGDDGSDFIGNSRKHADHRRDCIQDKKHGNNTVENKIASLEARKYRNEQITREKRKEKPIDAAESVICHTVQSLNKGARELSSDFRESAACVNSEIRPERTENKPENKRYAGFYKAPFQVFERGVSLTIVHQSCARYHEKHTYREIAYRFNSQTVYPAYSGRTRPEKRVAVAYDDEIAREQRKI